MFDPLIAPVGCDLKLRYRLKLMAYRRRRLGIDRPVARYATVGWYLRFIETNVLREQSA